MMLRDLLVNHLTLAGMPHGTARKYALSVRCSANRGSHGEHACLVQTLGGEYDDITRSLSPGQLHLAVSLAQIVDTSAYLNDQIKLYEQGEFAAALQKRLTGSGSANILIAPGRQLLRYGLLTMVRALSAIFCNSY